MSYTVSLFDCHPTIKSFWKIQNMTDMVGHKGTRLTLTLFKAQTGHVKNSSIWFKYRRQTPGIFSMSVWSHRKLEIGSLKGE